MSQIQMDSHPSKQGIQIIIIPNHPNFNRGASTGTIIPVTTIGLLDSPCSLYNNSLVVSPSIYPHFLIFMIPF